ncbi:carbohydrate ABC transporter permease [Amycolatopsis sp. PS_44_ISF1]|uniref:carbohydrate ABC transporter permease n=1 Tax=Amycolatopsis sp. PS_44_ISF1 TaxID=2974917 RepID=UPI0028E025DE|nr:carbohydrate ABC transporter permease [Amycolatopsis sp. PS_44_ISF1]MDT8914741.1 carbohydrate ABC transporter permease [Amycolatopsis sp. PS_44_ISF1]
MTPRERARRRRRTLRLLIAVPVALVLLFPLYWMAVVAFSPRADLLDGEVRLWPEHLTTGNFTSLFATYPVLTWLGNSLAISLVSAVLTVVVSTAAGYALAQLRFRGSNAIFLVALATLMVPVQVIMVAQFKLVISLHLYGTYWAVILPAVASAFGVFLARQFMLAIPRELVDAARMDGAGQFRTFVSVVLPLCKPLLAVLLLMSLLQNWNDFAWPLLALKENRLFTAPVGLLYLQGQYGSDYGGTMAFALLSVLPMVTLFLVFQRFFVQGFTRTGLK